MTSKFNDKLNNGRAFDVSLENADSVEIQKLIAISRGSVTNWNSRVSLKGDGATIHFWPADNQDTNAIATDWM